MVKLLALAVAAQILNASMSLHDEVIKALAEGPLRTRTSDIARRPRGILQPQFPRL